MKKTLIVVAFLGTLVFLAYAVAQQSGPKTDLPTKPLVAGIPLESV